MDIVLEHSEMTEVTPPTKPRGKEFSLGAAAKELGVVKSTVRGAIDRGELRATKNVQGHYQIEAAALWQYKSNREADQMKSAASGSASPKEEVRQTVRATGVVGGELSSAARGAPPRALEGSTLPPEKSVNELLLERENLGLKDKVQTLERHHAEYVKVTEMSLRLLPSPEKEVAAAAVAAPRSKAPLALAAVLVIAVAGIASILYPDTVRGLLTGQGTLVVDAAMLEAVPTAPASP